MLLAPVVVAPNDQATKPIAGNPGQQGYTEQNPIKAFLHDTFSDPVSFFTLALVGSTILLWRATLRLAREGRESASRSIAVAQDTAKRQLRAYVNTEDHDITGFFRGGPATLRMKIYNRGQTPAYDLKVWSIVSGTLEEPDDLKVTQRKKEDFRQSKSVLGPGQWMLHENGCQGPLGNEAYIGVAAGKIKMVFAGVVTYRDAFGRRHFTTFKQFYTGVGNWATQTADLTACGKGNNAS